MWSFVGCATVVRQDEVGVRETLGDFAEEKSDAGLKFYLWPFSSIQTFPINTKNLEVKVDLPSKEGLNVASEISILYRVIPERTPKILEEIGTNYEEALILPVFRSSAADVTARFDAKDMHTGKRAEIEREVREHMASLLEDRGFRIEAVLLKTIRLPSGLARSIEEKLQAEQDAQRMSFVLLQERKEAERRVIEAEGIRNAQKTIAQGLSRDVLHFQSIEVFRELSKSPNTKVIVTDGKAPLMIPLPQQDAPSSSSTLGMN
jgi:regulator of protease activity HflC (stomatin/prohibitin superfamily)